MKAFLLRDEFRLSLVLFIRGIDSFFTFSFRDGFILALDVGSNFIESRLFPDVQKARGRGRKPLVENSWRTIGKLETWKEINWGVSGQERDDELTRSDKRQTAADELGVVRSSRQGCIRPAHFHFLHIFLCLIKRSGLTGFILGDCKSDQILCYIFNKTHHLIFFFFYSNLRAHRLPWPLAPQKTYLSTNI